MFSDPITEKQRAFVAKLVTERTLPPIMDHVHATVIDGATLATRGDASKTIDWLLGLPTKYIAPPPVVTPVTTIMPVAGATLQPQLPAVEDGRYAIDDDQGVTKFYRVTHGKGWDKRIRLSVQASEAFYPVTSFAAKLTILEKIMVDPKAAQQRYGQLIGKCGMCGLALTDEQSRARGIGPICWGKKYEGVL